MDFTGKRIKPDKTQSRFRNGKIRIFKVGNMQRHIQTLEHIEHKHLDEGCTEFRVPLPGPLALPRHNL